MEKELINNFKPFSAELEERINYGIENYRKGEFKIKVVDKNGKPKNNAKILYDQTKHAFKFGANLFMLDEFETPEKNAKYREQFKKIFNMATIPFYWNATEPKQGKTRYGKDSSRIYRRPAPDLCYEYCVANGIEPREHGLAYENYFPNWAKALPTAELKNALEKRYKEMSERYAERTPNIEVTNETFRKGTTELFYSDDFVEWSFNLAEKYFANNTLSINEQQNEVFLKVGSNRDQYYMQIERALNKGARIDAIGFQYHMHVWTKEEMLNKPEAIAQYDLYYDANHMLKVLDKYSEFGLPLQITEITVPAFTLEKDDEILQAEILKKLYKLWFSHKNMQQIIYWNVVDGYAYGKQGDFNSGENFTRGGLLRYDLSEKPVWSMLDGLINEEWHSRGELVTDEDGYVNVKVFYGDYSFEIDGKKYNVSLTGNNNKIIICK